MRDLALKIVRQTFETYVTKNSVFTIPFTIPPELSKPDCGVYIMVFNEPGHILRGSQGSHKPTRPNLALEIQHQTILMVKKTLVTKQDLSRLSFELIITRTPSLLADLGSLRPEDGLMVRTDKSVVGISLPNGYKMNPLERLNKLCAQEGVDIASSSPRYYKFIVERFSESNKS